MILFLLLIIAICLVFGQNGANCIKALFQLFVLLIGLIFIIGLFL